MPALSRAGSMSGSHLHARGPDAAPSRRSVAAAMTEPERVHRCRAKGWKMPENTVYVGRPTKWGNPYQNPDDPSSSVESYWNAMEAGELGFTGEDVVRELRGKNLACWCALDASCHADVLLRLAN